jgi:hypothetical protein
MQCLRPQVIRPSLKAERLWRKAGAVQKHIETRVRSHLVKVRINGQKHETVHGDPLRACEGQDTYPCWPGHLDE